MTVTDDRLESVESISESSSPLGSNMMVRKRNGDLELVDLNKIVRAVERCAAGLGGVDPMRIATRTISGLCDGATTEELDDTLDRIGEAKGVRSSESLIHLSTRIDRRS